MIELPNQIFQKDRAGETGGANGSEQNLGTMTNAALNELIRDQYEGDINKAPEDIQEEICIRALGLSMGYEEDALLSKNS